MRDRLLPLVLYVGAALALDFVLPKVLNPYFFQVLILCGINVILAVSLNLVNGLTGQFSIGHAGFMAIGAYASAVLTMRVLPPVLASLAGLGVPAPFAQGFVLLVALVSGGLLAALAGLAVGLPSLRLRGDYLAIVTLGFGEIIRVLILNIDAIGAARGLSGVPNYTTFLWVALWAGAVVAVSYNLLRTTHGRAMLAVREDEIAAEALGVDTTRYKVTAFVVSAFFAGVAGGLFAHYLSYLNPSSFTFIKSIEVITMVVLGGMGSVSGSVVGAIALTVLPEALRPVKQYRMVIYALLLIVLMITRPQGLFGTNELRLPWPRRRREAQA
ncbi:MAG: branched-chain amino acid ABC transporter permease [Candidatus Eiseniibacteriota bacterium]